MLLGYDAMADDFDFYDLINQFVIKRQKLIGIVIIFRGIRHDCFLILSL
jgi:hypothetical protein